MSQASRRRSRAILLGFIGFAVTLPMALVLAVMAMADRTPALTTDALHASEQKWREAAVTDYDLEVQVGGVRSGKVSIQVRNGTPVNLTRDGVVPSRRETWGVWTVEGQFEMLRQELELAARPEEVFGPAAMLDPRAAFDDTLGYPRRYLRLVVGGQGDLDWKTVRFERR